VVTRLDDGRPGAEEAWSMIPRGEGATVVWTEEMAAAFGVVVSMIDSGEEIPARMAFKEKYAALVAEARDANIPVRWIPSLGHDPNGREAPLEEAVRKNRLTHQHAMELLPNIALHPTIVALIEGSKQEAA
jgi:hypothetical protein